MLRTFPFLLLLTIVGLGLPGCFLFGGDDDQPAPEPIPPIDQLPPITSEGKGTFGCLINGEVFVSKHPKAGADYTTVNVIDIGGDFDSPIGNISFQIREFYSENGLFYPPRVTMQYLTISDSSYCDYRIDDLIDGQVEIKEYNPFEYYVSGTFEFTSVNAHCDTLRVTDGRFDLKVHR